MLLGSIRIPLQIFHLFGIRIWLQVCKLQKIQGQKNYFKTKVH